MAAVPPRWPPFNLDRVVGSILDSPKDELSQAIDSLSLSERQAVGEVMHTLGLQVPPALALRVAASGSASRVPAIPHDLLPANEAEAPDELMCPIMRELFFDPVVVPNGRTYERYAITEWINGRINGRSDPGSPCRPCV